MAETIEPTVSDYTRAITVCAMAGNIIANENLPAIIEAISRADAIGPIMDPTLWREKAKAMGEDAELLRAALPLWKFVRKVRADASLKGATGG